MFKPFNSNPQSSANAQNNLVKVPPRLKDLYFGDSNPNNSNDPISQSLTLSPEEKQQKKLEVTNIIRTDFERKKQTKFQRLKKI